MAGEADTRIKEGRRMGRWVESGGNDKRERGGRDVDGWKVRCLLYLAVIIVMVIIA